MRGDRLPSRVVEVWAAGQDGKGFCGSGWIIGNRGVLTAYHVLKSFISKSPGVIEVRLGAESRPSAWYECTTLWANPHLDIALLEIVEPGILAFDDPSPVLAETGNQPILGCDIIGFPDAERRPDGLRNIEQVEGTLLPAGGGRGRMLHFEVHGSVPEESALWRGISGGGVRDEHGRLIGVVVRARSDRQNRRLIVTAASDIASEQGFAEVTARIGASSIVEARKAPLFRSIFGGAIGADGYPWNVADVPDLGIFGIKHPRILTGNFNHPYVTYVNRDKDPEITRAIDRAVSGEQRVILVVGDSGAGKSRAAAEAVRKHPVVANYKLLCPRALDVARLADLGTEVLSEAVVWLDDIDRYIEAGLDLAVLNRLFSFPQLLIVGTIRTSFVEMLVPHGNIRSPGWEVIASNSMGIVTLSAPFTPRESAIARRIIRDQQLVAALDAGYGLGEWLVAGPDLVTAFTHASRQHRAIIQAVIDWRRAGVSVPLMNDIARELWTEYFDESARARYMRLSSSEKEGLFTEASNWATTPVLGDILVGHAPLYLDADGLSSHDFLLDYAIRKDPPSPPIPDSVWGAALDYAISRLAADQGAMLWSVGSACRRLGSSGLGRLCRARNRTICESGYGSTLKGR